MSNIWHDHAPTRALMRRAHVIYDEPCIQYAWLGYARYDYVRCYSRGLGQTLRNRRCFARAWHVIDLSPTNRRAYAARRAFIALRHKQASICGSPLVHCTQTPTSEHMRLAARSLHSDTSSTWWPWSVSHATVVRRRSKWNHNRTASCGQTHRVFRPSPPNRPT